MLTGKQKQYLKALAVQLPAVVQIGKDGMSETVIQSVDDVLTARELIKDQSEFGRRYQEHCSLPCRASLLRDRADHRQKLCSFQEKRKEVAL